MASWLPQRAEDPERAPLGALHHRGTGLHGGAVESNGRRVVWSRGRWMKRNRFLSDGSKQCEKQIQFLGGIDSSVNMSIGL